MNIKYLTCMFKNMKDRRGGGEKIYSEIQWTCDFNYDFKGKSQLKRCPVFKIKYFIRIRSAENIYHLYSYICLKSIETTIIYRGTNFLRRHLSRMFIESNCRENNSKHELVILHFDDYLIFGDSWSSCYPVS